MVTVISSFPARQSGVLSAIAGVLAAAIGSAALAQTPVAGPPLDAAAAPLHGSCARRAARVIADKTVAPLARQGRWIGEIERGRRASFGVVLEAVAPERPFAEAFAALLDYAASAEAAGRYRDAATAADAVRRRYLALVHLLEAVLPVSEFERDSAGETAELLSAAERFLDEALADARTFRAALTERRLTAGVDYADEGTVRSALDEARTEYQQCVLAGTLAAGAGRAPEDTGGDAARCTLAVSGEARAQALPDVFRPSGLLAGGCDSALGAAPQIVAQAEALLAQRRQVRAAAGAAARPPAAWPERGPLREQVLSPAEMRAWLGRVYASEMFCHRDAASVYRAAMTPFIDAAEAVARATLDRELEARAARTRVELERRLAGLDRVLESAANIDDALAANGVRGVQNAGTSLTNLTGGARNHRDAFERALAALDPAALAAERARRLDAIADEYGAERRRLAEWHARFDWPPEPGEHPFVAGDSAAVDLEFPYGVQHPDRALRNGVTGAVTAANAHLNACRAVNAAVAALVHPAPASGVCDAWPPRDRFLQWGFVRAVERATVERCSVDLGALDTRLGLVPAPQDGAALERQAALAARVAAATPPPDLAGALGRVDALTSQFNDRLSEVERRLAAIRDKLAAQRDDRLAAVTAPSGDGTATDARSPPGDRADPASEPFDMDAKCRARETEQRAAMSNVLGQTVFVRYDEEAALQRWAQRPRPDGRIGSSDPCQVVYCSVGTRTYEECAAQHAASLARELEERQRVETRQRIDRNSQWILDNLLPGSWAATDRFYNRTQGDTWLERTADRAVTLACTMYSMTPGKWLRDLSIGYGCDARLRSGGGSAGTQ